MMYYRISKNEKNLFFGKKIAQVWAVTLKGGSMNVNICGQVIAYLENITNLEILPYFLHFSEVLKN